MPWSWVGREVKGWQIKLVWVERMTVVCMSWSVGKPHKTRRCHHHPKPGNDTTTQNQDMTPPPNTRRWHPPPPSPKPGDDTSPAAPHLPKHQEMTPPDGLPLPPPQKKKTGDDTTPFPPPEKKKKQEMTPPTPKPGDDTTSPKPGWKNKIVDDRKVGVMWPWLVIVLLRAIRDAETNFA